MKWKKKGLIYAPDKGLWWSQFYGMMPTPEFLKTENIIRVYFGITDTDKNGRATYIDLDADNPSKIIYRHNNFILDIGGIGMFDDSGVIPSSIVNVNRKKYLYYVGFQRCVKVPYMLFSGLAINENNQGFVRYSDAPIIDRNSLNAVSNAAPYVIRHDGIFKMWFWLGKEWTTVNNKLYIKAEICYAESSDGLQWNLFDKPCIKLNPEKEFSVGRPCVIFEDGKYKMWYSVRTLEKLYRLGYAESPNGIDWLRRDEESGIDVSESGWDSEMICYPAVIKVKNKTFLFYNGNNNGETGFGYAELDNDKK